MSLGRGLTHGGSERRPLYFGSMAAYNWVRVEMWSVLAWRRGPPTFQKMAN